MMGRDRVEIIMNSRRYRMVPTKMPPHKRCNACAFKSCESDCDTAYDLAPCERGVYPNRKEFYFKEV
jgi:hypothetical protein